MADLDDGYTRIANELYEALIGADLTKHQFKVVLAVIRKTYGFNQTHDRITNGQIAEMTGLPETRVCTAKNQLLEMGILVNKGRKIGPNKVLSEWNFDLPRNGEKLPETGCKNFPETGNGVSPKQGNTKDTIQKTVKTTTDGASACAEPPAATPEKRPGKNTPYQAILDAYHEALPEMPAIRELTDSRKTKIRNFWTKFKFDETRWRAYLDFIAKNCRWMCESRQRRDGESAWKPKNLDFLVTERCYLGVREGRFNDE